MCFLLSLSALITKYKLMGRHSYKLFQAMELSISFHSTVVNMSVEWQLKDFSRGVVAKVAEVGQMRGRWLYINALETDLEMMGLRGS